MMASPAGFKPSFRDCPLTDPCVLPYCGHAEDARCELVKQAIERLTAAGSTLAGAWHR